MMITYGSTSHFVVAYDSSFTGGAQPSGTALAQGVVDMCEYDLVRLEALFGMALPASHFPITINLVPGPGGANNNGTNTINVFCNSSSDTLGTPAIVVAEAAEIFMVAQNKGWIASWSNGEALSRVSATILYPERAWLFQTGNQWLNGVAGSPNPARSNWVDNVYHSDQDAVSVGCGTLFLNYLTSQFSIQWPAIFQAGAPTTNTLAETATLCGAPNSWPDFFALIQEFLPAPTTLPAKPTQIGQPPEPTDNPFPMGSVSPALPALYMRHNLADTGTSHTGSLSDSPDIIVRNAPTPDPQATSSTAASIASDTLSDPIVKPGQTNYVYARVWNGGAFTANVFAMVYWSPPSTLVSPNLWTLVGSAYYPEVSPGEVKVSVPGITWPADRLPPAGHDCFVATVGTAVTPAPNPAAFADFDAFMDYIYANNDITWRNFNVGVTLPPHPLPHPGFGAFVPLPFMIAGAWDKPRAFTLEIEAALPAGSQLALQVPAFIGKALAAGPRPTEAVEDMKTDPAHPRRLRVAVPSQATHRLGTVELPAKTIAASHLLVHVPGQMHPAPLKVVVRQMYGDREAGRITWMLTPARG
jgi:hypothetical protein